VAARSGSRFLVFLCSAPGYHLDLHSFPTRRSSDLLLPPRRPFFFESGLGWRLAALLIALCVIAPVATLCWHALHGSMEHWTHLRSEEHTSELQSRENLVCRLLLEKKK